MKTRETAQNLKALTILIDYLDAQKTRLTRVFCETNSSLKYQTLAIQR